MSIKYSLIYLLLILNIIIVKNEYNPKDLNKNKIDRIIKEFKGNKNKDETKNKMQIIIKSLLKNNDISMLTYFLDNLHKNGIYYKSILKKEIELLEKYYISIKDKFNQIQTVIPAFRWAQSNTTVFIEVKWGHRLDSPSCLEPYNISHLVVNNSILNISSYCKYDGYPIKFELIFKLFKSVNYTNSNFTEVNGRLQIALDKNKHKNWKRLTYIKNQKFPDMKIWFEMKEKYFNEEMDANEDILDKNYKKYIKKRNKNK